MRIRDTWQRYFFALGLLAAYMGTGGCTVDVRFTLAPTPAAAILQAARVGTPLPAPRTPEAATPAPAAEVETPQVVAPPGTVFQIFYGPNYGYGIAGVVYPGEKFIVTGRNATNEWLQIMYGAETAWVQVDDVVRDNPDAFGPGGSAIPVVPDPPTPTPNGVWLTAP